MNWKPFCHAAILSGAVLLTPNGTALAQDATSQSTNNCDSGDKIDGTTANDAKSKLEAAGYTDVAKLFKGCDNVWHGQARIQGAAVNVMVAPDGSVRQETD